MLGGPAGGRTWQRPCPRCLPGLRDPSPRPSADGPRVPVPPSEGHAGADSAGCAPRSPRFPSAEELSLPQQRWGSVSATSRRGAGLGGGQGSPGSSCSGVHPGHPGLLPAALQDREPLDLTTTHLHPLWVQLVQAATRAGSVVDLKLIPVTAGRCSYSTRGT